MRKRGTAVGPPPARGGRRGRGTRPTDPSRPCLNCGDPTPGEYCPTCGQRKVDVQVSVRVLMLDVLEDQFILDRRLPRTLAALFLHPGRLTVEYVNGRMASYIHPFRLYLVASLLFFLLLSFTSLQLVRRATVDVEGPGDPATAAFDPAADSIRLAEYEQELATLDSILADSALPGAAAAGVQLGRSSLLRSRQRVLARLDSAAGRTDPAAPPAPIAPGDSRGDTAQGPLPEDTAGAVAPTDAVGGRGTLSEIFGWDEEGRPDVPVPEGQLRSALETRLDRLGRMQPREAAEELLGTFLNYIPTLMFLLLPIFAVVLKLLYVRRGRFYAEHFVFLLHVHVFVFLLATVMLLLRRHVSFWFELALLAWILVYIPVALKRVYGQGWGVTLLKSWVLGWTYFLILAVSLPFALVATFFLF